MSEWIPLTATEPSTLQALLQANGLPADDAAVLNIWDATQNRANHRGEVRPPYQINAGETWYVPPPPLPADAVLSTYRCTGSEASTDEIVATIRAAHGEAAEEQLTVAPDAFTADYVLGLAFNQRFRSRRRASPPIEIAAGETLRYPTRRRRTRTLDVSPSTALRSSTNPVPTGDGPFVVRVELASNGQIMKILNVVPEARGVDPHQPGSSVDAQWRPTDGKVRFKITITPRTGNVTPTRVTIRVRKADATVYFTEERTDWTTNGEHTWEWDGFTAAAPAAGSIDTADVDTRVLRGRLTIEVVVQAASGWSLGSLELANAAHKAGFIDVHKVGTNINAYAYISFHHAGDDAGLWAATIIGGILAGGAVAGVIAAIGMPVDSAVNGPRTPEQERDWGIALGVTAGAVAAAFIGIIGALVATSRLSETDFNTLKGHIEQGITAHWVNPTLRIAGHDYHFQAQPVTGDGHDRVRYGLVSAAIVQRACNLVPLPLVSAVFVPFLANDRPHNMYNGAHEFGHSVMLQTGDLGWSMHHKGSTDLSQNTVTGASPPAFRHPPAPTMTDLMIYYDEPYHILYNRMAAAPYDMLGWIEVTQIEFRAM